MDDNVAFILCSYMLQERAPIGVNRNCHVTILLNQTRPGEKSPGLFVAPGGCGLDGNLRAALAFSMASRISDRGHRLNLPSFTGFGMKFELTHRQNVGLEQPRILQHSSAASSGSVTTVSVITVSLVSRAIAFPLWSSIATDTAQMVAASSFTNRVLFLGADSLAHKHTAKCDFRFRRDSVAKVALPKVSKFLRAAGAFFV